MFERFTDDARAVVVQAQDEARALGHGWIGTEHLLLAVLAGPETPLAQTLAGLGLTHDAARAQLRADFAAGIDDGAALRDYLGIDLDAVRRRVEDRFGPGALDPQPPARARRWWRRRRCSTEARHEGSGGRHIPFSRRAKKSLELALREALAQRSKEIRVAHLVLGLMRTDGVAAGVVTRLGLRPHDVRKAVLDLGLAA